MGTLARQQHFHIVLISAVALAFAGCGPLGSGKPSPLPTAATVPSAEPASPPPRPTPISHATGATDVILRMETGGGLVPMDFLATQIPQFTLYGDGSAIYKAQTATVVNSTDKQPQPDQAFRTAKLTEEEVQALLESALNAGHLGVAKPSYSLAGVADGPTTLFSITAGGLNKTVSVYALGLGTPFGDESDDREHMAALASRLSNFEADPGHDPSTAYDPVVYRVFLFRATTSSQSTSVEWPWSDVSVGDFLPSDERPGDVMVMSREQVSKLTKVPNGGQAAIWVASPDVGMDVMPLELAVRPLLPDEIPSAD